MLKKQLLITIFTLLISSTLAWAGDPSGTWLASNGKSHVKIYKCGGGYCAKVISLQDPLGPDDKPKLDLHNKNKSLRNRKIIGIKIMNDLRPTTKKDQWKGKIYNPEDGKTYTAYMTLHNSILKVQGCVAGIFCKSQNWRKK